MVRSIVLFAHGARDPAWARPLHDIAARLRAQLPGADVRIAFLELLQPELRAVLDELAAMGVDDICVAPVFWAAGGHVRVDLPKMVAQFGAIHPGIRVRVLPVLSELPGMNELVARAISLSANEPG
jgi:sirohydrochlorin cobaltochelatase